MSSQWTRLIRFTAVETRGSKIHLGQPIDPNVDGGSFSFSECVFKLVVGLVLIMKPLDISWFGYPQQAISQST